MLPFQATQLLGTVHLQVAPFQAGYRPMSPIIGHQQKIAWGLPTPPSSTPSLGYENWGAGPKFGTYKKSSMSNCTATSKFKYSTTGSANSPSREYWAYAQIEEVIWNTLGTEGQAGYTASFQVTIFRKCRCGAPVLDQLEDAKVWQILGWRNWEHNRAYCSVHDPM